MKITVEEQEIRKMRILRTAFRLFGERGIDAVTVETVAKEAKVGVNSVYRYFTNKTELARQALKLLCREYMQEMADSLLSQGDFARMKGLDQIRALLDGYMEMYRRHREYSFVYSDYKLNLIRHGGHMTQLEYSEMFLPLHNIYLEAIKKGLGDGSIAAGCGAEKLSAAVLGMVRSYASKVVAFDLIYEGQNPWQQEFSVVRSIILGALQNGLVE